MCARLFPAISALALLTGCFSPAPGGVDSEGPRIRLTLLNGYARPSFDSAETPPADDNLCGKVANFPGTPARVAVSLSDPGGIDRVSLRVLVGEIIDSSLVAAPDWTVTHRMDPGVDTAEVVFRRAGSDRVLTNALVVFDVTAATGGDRRRRRRHRSPRHRGQSDHALSGGHPSGRRSGAVPRRAVSRRRRFD